MRLKLIAIGRRHVVVLQMHSKRWVPYETLSPSDPGSETRYFLFIARDFYGKLYDIFAFTM